MSSSSRRLPILLLLFCYQSWLVSNNCWVIGSVDGVLFSGRLRFPLNNDIIQSFFFPISAISMKLICVCWRCYRCLLFLMKQFDWKPGQKFAYSLRWHLDEKKSCGWRGACNSNIWMLAAGENFSWLVDKCKMMMSDVSSFSSLWVQQKEEIWYFGPA